MVKVEPAKPIIDQVQTEIAGYRQEPGLPVNSNPLVWWKCHSSKYPILGRLAKKFLGGPATSVSSERVFSPAGDIVTSQRASLDPDQVDRLMFLKKNLQI